MRIMIKGGVWKNTEDEILKAAVMKYGLNQWARISSLLVRKTPKQCKARWYEWLDPSIRKTEWTRDEEEKLLHLAKLMPTQWRTIASIMSGRTAAQCLEHYEKLLDRATEKDEEMDERDDPRKLRPGEIDPNPETKPARPDPVDMDEDEKEMLQEARARLANTKGKKAKRKAREKQLQEARRIASLQKRRELKAAGLEGYSRKRRRRDGIDYNQDVPFEMKPPPGFYDTVGEEKTASQPNFIGRSREALDNRNRGFEEEEQRRLDTKRQKVSRDENLPTVISQINKMNDPGSVHTRSKLALPSPQVGDGELEEIAKMHGVGKEIQEGEEGSAATRALLAPSGGETPLPTPARTPMRTPLPTEDRVMMEAQNLAAISRAETPLKGGENAPLHDIDYSGLTPKKHVVQTPNPLATPRAQTPSHSYLGTPRTYEPGTPRSEISHAKSELKNDLRNLPKPKNEYKLVVPGQEGADEADHMEIEPDAEELDRLNEEQRRLREEALMRLRSQPVQRGLPRPTIADVAQIGSGMKKPEEIASLPSARQQAEELVRSEAIMMMHSDAIRHPPPSAKKAPQGRPPRLEKFSETELEEAKVLLTMETQEVEAEAAHDLSTFTNIWTEVADDMTFAPSVKRFQRSAVATAGDKLAALEERFAAVENMISKDGKRTKKLEGRVNLLVGGYQQRITKALETITANYVRTLERKAEVDVFKALEKSEAHAVQRRVTELQEATKAVQESEQQLQQRYLELAQTKEEIQNKLGGWTVVVG
eukprot:Rmarinus@m.16593